jgi:hypothetical protein
MSLLSPDTLDPDEVTVGVTPADDPNPGRALAGLLVTVPGSLRFSYKGTVYGIPFVPRGRVLRRPVDRVYDTGTTAAVAGILTVRSLAVRARPATSTALSAADGSTLVALDGSRLNRVGD